MKVYQHSRTATVRLDVKLKRRPSCSATPSTTKMSKRKDTSDGQDSDSSDVSLVDVDFEFFDLNPDVDHIALKRLITQQLQADATLIDAHALADLIFAEPRIGSSIKCDGPESDPYAILTLVNMSIHRNTTIINSLVDYLLSKISQNTAFLAQLQTLLSPNSPSRVGFIFCERLINMPVQVIPPLYRMLVEELANASPNSEHTGYTHFIFLSRIYRLSADEEAELLSRRSAAKKQSKAKAKKANVAAGGGTFSFHPEDEHIQRIASHTLDYSFTQSTPRDAESFGLDTGGRVMLVTADKLAGFAETISQAYAGPLP